MHLRDIAIPLPVVTRATTGLDAARRIAGDRLAALVVADAHGRPASVLPASAVLGLLVPRYLREDPRLAAVLDDAGADELWDQAGHRTVGELLDRDDVRVYDLVTVDADATLAEVVSLMAAAGTSVALLDDPAPGGPWFLTLPAVLDAALAARRPERGDARS